MVREWISRIFKKKSKFSEDMSSQAAQATQSSPSQPSSQSPQPSQQQVEQVEPKDVEVKKRLFGLRKEEYVGGEKLPGVTFLADVQHLATKYELDELKNYLKKSFNEYLKNKEYGELFTKLLFATIMKSGGIETYYSMITQSISMRVRDDVVKKIAGELFKERDEAERMASIWEKKMYEWIRNLYAVGDFYPGHGWSSFTALVHYFAELRKEKEREAERRLSSLKEQVDRMIEKYTRTGKWSPQSLEPIMKELDTLMQDPYFPDKLKDEATSLREVIDGFYKEKNIEQILSQMGREFELLYRVVQNGGVNSTVELSTLSYRERMKVERRLNSLSEELNRVEENIKNMPAPIREKWEEKVRERRSELEKLNKLIEIEENLDYLNRRIGYLEREAGRGSTTNYVQLYLREGEKRRMRLDEACNYLEKILQGILGYEGVSERQRKMAESLLERLNTLVEKYKSERRGSNTTLRTIAIIILLMSGILLMVVPQEKLTAFIVFPSATVSYSIGGILIILAIILFISRSISFRR